MYLPKKKGASVHWYFTIAATPASGKIAFTRCTIANQSRLIRMSPKHNFLEKAYLKHIHLVESRK